LRMGALAMQIAASAVMWVVAIRALASPQVPH
jgi:hypothetical protein